jgi:flagellar biosynthetic protein FliS
MQGARQSLTGPAAYRAVEGIGAKPEELMKMAMDALQMFFAQAEAAIAVGNRTAKGKALNSAAQLIEFVLGLTGSEPGPLSSGLAEVYRYVLGAIVRANAWDDAEAIVAGRVVIEQLAAIWRRAFPDALGSESTAVAWC